MGFSQAPRLLVIAKAVDGVSSVFPPCCGFFGYKSRSSDGNIEQQAMNHLKVFPSSPH